MSEKPSYLGLLNAISLGESEAEIYLNTWVASTKRADVRSVVAFVAVREGEHGKAFAKRICELGYDVLPRDTSDCEAKVAIASSTTLTDREKFEKLQVGRAPRDGQRDIFASFFDDASIDVQTGALLGRYIAEERDSGRRLRACYEALCAEEDACVATGSAGSMSGADNAMPNARLAEPAPARSHATITTVPMTIAAVETSKSKRSSNSSPRPPGRL